MQGPPAPPAPDGHLLLTEADFVTQVLARSAGNCVVCRQPAVAVHQLFDGRLFPDGGFYLDNGAAVCALHRRACETTVLSVEMIRRYGRIRSALLPPGLDANASYDKWGNRFQRNPSEKWRWAGPLMAYDDARAAIDTAGLFDFMMSTPYWMVLPVLRHLDPERD